MGKLDVLYDKFKNEGVFDKVCDLLKKDEPTFGEMGAELKLQRDSLFDLIKVMRYSGYPIMEQLDLDTGDVTYYMGTLEPGNKYPIGYNPKSIAVMADTHIGDEISAIDELNEFYKIVISRGINTVIHCGDIINGVGVYPGQDDENSIKTIEEQCRYVAENYPRMPEGGATYFITGNHDLKQTKKDPENEDPGVLIVKYAEELGRDDLKYMGQNSVRVVFQNEFTIGVEHNLNFASPLDRAKTHNRFSAEEDLADMYAFGHKHLVAANEINGTLYLESGCFKKQRAKEFEIAGIHYDIGMGWIVNIDDGVSYELIQV